MNSLTLFIRELLQNYGLSNLYKLFGDCCTTIEDTIFTVLFFRCLVQIKQQRHVMYGRLHLIASRKSAYFVTKCKILKNILFNLNPSLKEIVVQQ